MRRSGLAAVVALLTVIASGCGQTAPAAAPGPPTGDLQAEVKALRELVPDQAAVMTHVSYHFGNLWFAGRAGNWPLASFYLSETRSNLRWAVRTKPVRKDNAGRDVALASVLEAFENGPLAQLQKAVDGHDQAALVTTYKESLAGCYACHKASDKPYLRPQVPTEPETRVINFDPEADWPL